MHYFRKGGMLVFSFICSIYLVVADEVKTKPESQFAKQTIRLKEISPSAEVGRLASLGFSIDCAEKQNLSDGGVKVRVSFKNNGTKKLALRNPLEFLNVVLINESGRKVTLRRPVFIVDRRLKIRSEEKDREFPFTLDSVSINNQLLSRTEINARQLELAPSDNFVVDFTLSKIYQKPDMDEVVVPIPAGRYRVRLQLMVLDASSVKVRRTVQSSEIAVLLTPENEIR